MKFAFVVMAVTLVLAVPAQAAPWTAAEQTEAIAVADAHWPTSPCFGTGHNLDWLSGAQLAGQEIAIGTTGSCNVLVETDRMATMAARPEATPAVWLCTVLEHEFGHNAGLGHSDDPHNVMYGELAYPADDCVTAFANWTPPVVVKPAVKKHKKHRHIHKRRR
jgi:hypothetical protein